MGIDFLGKLAYNFCMAAIEKSAWFVVNTKPKQEFIAEKNLISLGADVYLPVYLKKKKKNKEKIEVISPLFAGYLFAQFSLKNLYHKVRYTRGVKSVLGSNDCIWTIENSKIDDIKSREKEGVVVLKKRKKDFEKGDQILVDEGDFDGWEGIFYEELPDRERAIIMLTNVSFTSKLIVPKKYLILNN